MLPRMPLFLFRGPGLEPRIILGPGIFRPYTSASRQSHLDLGTPATAPTPRERDRVSEILIQSEFRLREDPISHLKVDVWCPVQYLILPFFFIRFEAFRDCRIQRNIIGSEISRPEAGRWRLMPVDCPAQELPNHDVLNFTGHENHPLEFFFPSKFSLSLYMCTKINQKITKEPQIYEIYMRFRKFLILKKILKYFIYYSTQWYMEKN